MYDRIEKIALELYTRASEHARECGLILADTKFEFGIAPLSSLSTSINSPSSLSSFSLTLLNEDDVEEAFGLLLIDEALTPDSSPYWPAAGYAPGGGQPSFDKQFLRDWMVGEGFRKGLESGPEGREGAGWVMTEEVLEGTRKRYLEALEMLTGEGL